MLKEFHLYNSYNLWYTISNKRSGLRINLLDLHSVNK